MADDNKLSAKAGVDTTDFKTGIAAMNRDLRVLESGFRASAASLGDWSKDATGLESRIKTLSSAMEIQEKKVAATRAEYERIKAEKGENSRAAQELEIKLNKETETLGKMGVELQETEGALAEMTDGTEEAESSVDELGNTSNETGNQLEAFKSVLGGVGTVIKGTVTVVLGLVAAVAAVAAAIGGLVFSTASASAELVDLSSKTGISTTALQEMSYIGEQVGVSLDTITGAQSRLVRAMNEGRDGTGDQAEAFKTLGIAVTDAQGNLRSTQDVFAETIDALGKIENPAERDAIAMQLFGKSAQELNPLIKAGSVEMAALAEEAHKVGAVMSEEDVAAFEAFDDTLASLQAGLKGTLGTLAGAFLPGFQAVFDQLGGYLQQFTDIVKGSDGDLGKIAEGLTGLVTQIATDIAAQAPQMMAAGLEIVKSILDAITQALPSMLTAAIEILTTLIDFIVVNLPTLISAGVEIILTLVDALIANLPMLVTAAIEAIITLANGLTEALPTLIPAMVEAIVTIVNALLANLPMLVDAAMQLIIALAQGLLAALPVLIAAIPEIVQSASDALVEAGPLFVFAAGELIGMLATGLIAAIPVALSAIGQLIDVLIGHLKRLPEAAKDAARQFIQGLINGIENGAGALYDAISNLVDSMLDAVGDIIGGGNAPLRQSNALGNDFVNGLSLGSTEAVRNIENAFANLAGLMANAAAGNYAAAPGAGIGSSVQTDSFQFFAPVIVRGDTPPGSLGARLKTKRF